MVFLSPDCLCLKRYFDVDGNHVANDVVVDFHHSIEAKNASKEGNWRKKVSERQDIDSPKF